MKKKWVITIIFISILIGTSLIFAIRNKGDEVKVKTYQVKKGHIEEKLSITGIVESKYTKSYYGYQGRVKEINYSIGHKINKGEIMLTYDIQDYSSQIKQSEIQYENAILQLKELKSQKEFIEAKINELDKSIYKLNNSINPLNKPKIQGLKKQKELIQTIPEEKIKQAENLVKLSKINLDTLKSNCEKITNSIIAEDSGIITEINVCEGAIDSGVKPAIVVQKIDILKVVSKIGKYDSNKIKVGQPAIIKKDGISYNGMVSFIEPTAKKEAMLGSSETTQKVEIDVKTNSNLVIGFETDLEIITAKANNVVVVPIESLMDINGTNASVYKVKDGIVFKTTVNLGIQSDNIIEIKKGVSEGDKVILNPNSQLKEGTKIQEESR